MEKKKRNQYEFDKKKYDHVHLQLPKGQKAVVQAHAAEAGESLNGLLNRLILAELGQTEWEEMVDQNEL